MVMVVSGTWPAVVLRGGTILVQRPHQEFYGLALFLRIFLLPGIQEIDHSLVPADLHFQFPHLTLGQIHSALAYYWDHRDELDQDIARRLAAVEHRRRQTPRALLYDHLESGR